MNENHNPATNSPFTLSIVASICNHNYSLLNTHWYTHQHIPVSEQQYNLYTHANVHRAIDCWNAFTTTYAGACCKNTRLWWEYYLENGCGCAGAGVGEKGLECLGWKVWGYTIYYFENMVWDGVVLRRWFSFGYRTLMCTLLWENSVVGQVFRRWINVVCVGCLGWEKHFLVRGL